MPSLHWDTFNEPSSLTLSIVTAYTPWSKSVICFAPFNLCPISQMIQFSPAFGFALVTRSKLLPSTFGFLLSWASSPSSSLCLLPPPSSLPSPFFLLFFAAGSSPPSPLLSSAACLLSLLLAPLTYLNKKHTQSAFNKKRTMPTQTRTINRTQTNKPSPLRLPHLDLIGL